jgi:hypothetical protein
LAKIVDERAIDRDSYVFAWFVPAARNWPSSHAVATS